MTAIDAGAPTPSTDRASRRRELERRAGRLALASAVLTVWTIGVWFWGIFLAVQLALGLLLPALLGRSVGEIVLSAGPVGPPQIFLFVMGIITGAGFLTIHVAAGGTRRAAWRGWVVAAPVLGASFALVGTLSTALVRLVQRAVGDDASPGLAPLDGAIPSGAALAVLGTVTFLVGLAVNLGYRRFGGRRGTLLLPLVLAPGVLAHVALVQDGRETVAVTSSPLGWCIALLCVVAAAAVAHMLLRRIPIA